MKDDSFQSRNWHLFLLIVLSWLSSQEQKFRFGGNKSSKMKLFLDSEGFGFALLNVRSLVTASNRYMYEINICIYLSYICMQCSNNIWISFNELFNILCAYLQILLTHINFIYTIKNWLPKNSFVQQFEVRKLYHSCFGTLSQENKLFLSF